MAGAQKKRAREERKPEGSSNGSSSESRDPTQRSVPKSIPRLDGNRDPSRGNPVDYSKPTDLKNISDFLGIAGWYTARGVSANSFVFQLAYSCPLFATHVSIHTLFESCKRARARSVQRLHEVFCLVVGSI